MQVTPLPPEIVAQLQSLPFHCKALLLPLQTSGIGRICTLPFAGEVCGEFPLLQVVKAKAMAITLKKPIPIINPLAA